MKLREAKPIQCLACCRFFSEEDHHDIAECCKRDWCTDPDNCPRCKAATWDQVNYHHVGIPIGAQK